MQPNQIPTPPIEMVMPPVNSVIALICYVLLGAFTLWTLYECRRTRSPVTILMLIGGTLAIAQEPLLAHIGSFWYPDIGPAPVMRVFNVSIPLWAVAAYGLYVGGLSILVYRKMVVGMTAKSLWIAYFSIWVFNIGLELPGLSLGIYRYYGDPPFNFFGFPLTWAITNSAIPMLASAVMVGFKDFLTGPRLLLIVPLMVMIGMAAEGATGLPTWLAMNSGSGSGVKLAGAFTTLGMSLLITHMVSLKFCKPAKY